MQIDTLVMIIADQNGGKSNQIRSIFQESELYNIYNGYPIQNNIARRFNIDPDIELLVRLSSWHERGEDYNTVKADLKNGFSDPRRRHKAIVAAQVTRTPNLVSGDDLLMQILADFDVRRAYAVWLSPDCSGRSPFKLSSAFASLLSTNRHVSALAIDAEALHPSAAPKANTINARLLADLLFRT